MYKKIIEFWFNECKSEQWWQKDDQFDLMVKKRFGLFHNQAKVCELYQWRQTALGSLAEIIILDQFSRNIFRNQPEAFAYDSLALILAQNAISKGYDLELARVERSFFYLPFMHSESKTIHQEALALYESLGDSHSLEFEQKHKVIIDQFGRYPHRNKIMGRESTLEEIAFLKLPNSSF